MTRAIPVILLAGLFLTGCRTSEEIFQHGEILTYEQYQSIKVEDGPTAQTILERYGRPKIAHETDDRITRLVYRCEDMTGRFRDLELVFDENQVLTEKRL